MCKEFDVNWFDIIGSNRKSYIVDARHAFMYIMTDYLKQSSIETGADCYKDHSTVLNAVHKINGFLFTNDPVAGKIINLKKIIQNEIEAIQNQAQQADAGELTQPN